MTNIPGLAEQRFHNIWSQLLLGICWHYLCPTSFGHLLTLFMPNFFWAFADIIYAQLLLDICWHYLCPTSFGHLLTFRGRKPSVRLAFLACLAHRQTVVTVDTNSYPKHPPLTYPGPVGMGIWCLYPLGYGALWLNLSVLIWQSWLHRHSRHVYGLWIDDSNEDLNLSGAMANFIHTGSHST